MRAPKLVLPAFFVVLAACATPTIRLSPSFVPGEVRTYRLHTTSTSTLDLAGRATTVRAELTGRSSIQIVSSNGEETNLHLTVTWERYERDGKTLTPPAEQSADLVAGPDGTVSRITSIGGVPPEVAGANVETIAPLLGPSLPTYRVHLGDTWTHVAATPSPSATAVPVAAGRTEQGRVVALRVVNGYRCAIVRIGSRKPITRTQVVGGQQVELRGDEFATTEVAYAFRSGFAAEVTSTARAHFALRTGTFTDGALDVDSTTVMTKT